MRVLEAGGTVEQHKAAVAAATAMKFDGECDKSKTYRLLSIVSVLLLSLSIKSNKEILANLKLTYEIFSST